MVWMHPGVFLTIHPLQDNWIVSAFMYSRSSCYEHSCIGFWVNISFHFSGIKYRKAIAGLYGKHMFSFFQKTQNCFSRGAICVHPYWKCVSSPVSPHPCQFSVVYCLL